MTNSFESRVSKLQQQSDFIEEFYHNDGSYSAIFWDWDPEHANPRNNDGNVACLVMQRKRYHDLDAPHDGIENAIERWGVGEHVQIPNVATLPESETLTRRYLAMFFPEVIAYVERWEVTGGSQSDWAYGYAYVLREDAIEALGGNLTGSGWTRAHYGDLTGESLIAEFADKAIEQELETYRQYFAGEVFGVVHLEPGGEIFTTDFTGATAECRHCGRAIEDSGLDSVYRWIDPEAPLSGDDSIWRESCERNDTFTAEHEPTRLLKDEESCWGFLSYDDFTDMLEQFTDSPVAS